MTAEAAWVARSGQVVRELVTQHAELAAASGRSRRWARSDAEAIGSVGAGPEVPVRVEVLDLRRAIAEDAGRYSGLVRGTLRLGREGVGSTAGRLLLIADNLPDLNAADRALMDEVAHVFWAHARDAARFVEPVRRRRVHVLPGEACPACGGGLWIDWRVGRVSGWRVACGVCGGAWAASERVTG